MTKPCLKRSSSSQSLKNKSVHFGTITPDCVHEADEWDRTPIAPATSLSYAEALELKAIQLSLPTATQPKDPFTGKALGGHGICGTKIPVALVPLLPESSEWKAHPLSPPATTWSRNNSPSSSPTHSPKLPSRALPPFHHSPATVTPQPALTTPAHLSFLAQLMPTGSPCSSRHNSRPPSPSPQHSPVIPPAVFGASPLTRPAVTVSPTTFLQVVKEDPEVSSRASSPQLLPTPPVTPAVEIPPAVVTESVGGDYTIQVGPRRLNDISKAPEMSGTNPTLDLPTPSSPSHRNFYFVPVI